VTIGSFIDSNVLSFSTQPFFAFFPFRRHTKKDLILEYGLRFSVFVELLFFDFFSGLDLAHENLLAPTNQDFTRFFLPRV